MSSQARADPTTIVRFVWFSLDVRLVPILTDDSVANVWYWVSAKLRRPQVTFRRLGGTMQNSPLVEWFLLVIVLMVAVLAILNVLVPYR
jgi:hypothetical protein